MGDLGSHEQPWGFMVRAEGPLGLYCVPRPSCLSYFASHLPVMFMTRPRQASAAGMNPGVEGSGALLDLVRSCPHTRQVGLTWPLRGL